MSSYILLEVVEKVNRINDVSMSFEAYADFGLMDNDYNNILIKIDTGCSISTIPYYRLWKNEYLCKKKKQEDINDDIPYTFSYGVETGGRHHRIPRTRKGKLKCEAIKFKHNIEKLTIAGCEIGDCSMYVNYDRRGNILIGPDILQRFDSLMGISRDSGKYIMLACPRDQVDKREFYEEVRRHFGFVPKKRT